MAFAFWGCDMEQTAAGIFSRFGTDLVISGQAGQRQVRGFFRAVNAKSWQGMESQATLLGEISRGQYLYLGPAAVTVREGDVLTLDGRQYVFRRVEAYHYGNQVVYRWGLCVEKGVNDTWGTQS